MLSIIIPLITTPYLSRIIGPEGVGIYSYNYSIAYFFMLFIMLGVNNYGNRSIAQTRESKEKLSQTFFSIYALQVALGICFTTIYIGYSFFISKNHNAALIMGMFVVSAIFDINWFFFGIEKFKFTVIRNSLFKILTTVCIFVFVKSPKDTLVYCTIMAIGTLLSQLALWSYLRKEVDVYIPKFKEVFIHLKPNLFLFVTVIAVSMFKYMDKIMLGSLSNIEQVGFYESSEKIIAVPTAFITALGTVMLPRISNMMASGEEYNETLLNKSILFAMFISSSMCFGIMTVSQEFIPLFYGEGYTTCIYLYLILLPSCLFLAFANVVRTQYLLPMCKDRIYVMSAIVGAAVNLIVNALMIPSFGAIGAAIGTLFAETAVCLYQVLNVRNEVPIKKYVAQSMVFVLAGLSMFLIIFNLSFNFDSLFIIMILKIGIGIGIYCTAVFILSSIFRINILKLLKDNLLKFRVGKG